MKNNENEKTNPQINSLNPSKRPRRSKNDQIGRNKQCKYCEKRYLSYIALNIHIKTKHFDKDNKDNKPIGRPRKSVENEKETLKTNLDFSFFFESSLKRMKNEENFDFFEIFKESFKKMYDKYNEILFKSIGYVDDIDNITYDFIINTTDNKNKDNNDKTTDNSLWKYIEYVSTKTNKDYFQFLVKIIILYREFLHQIAQKHKEIKSQPPSSDDIPYYSNEFICDFMESFNFFETDDDLKEVVEVVMHVCNWLWENKFTCFRLSLLS